MKRWVLFCGVMLLFAGAASAQDYPKVEAFGGYAYGRLSSEGVGANLNGGEASVAYNLNSYLGVVGDFSGFHGGNSFGNGDLYTYLFGPKVAMRRGKFTPFAQALFGGAHVTAGSSDECLAVVREGDGCSDTLSQNSFSMAIGGGADYNLTPLIGVRVLQADYLMTNFDGRRQNGVRISTGITIRF
jgi:opacity protein-like surface antigen